MKKIQVLAFLFLTLTGFLASGGSALGAEHLSVIGFNDFFMKNYRELLCKLCPDADRERIFEILFNAYSIKFKTIDYEYVNALNSLCSGECSENENEIKKYLRNLKEALVEEYESFLDDLSFEICEDENFENRIIKKEKRRFKKDFKRRFKKLISKCG